MVKSDPDQALIQEARKRLVAFAGYTKKDYAPGNVHYDIAERLEELEAGTLSRVILSVPPRCGKTELAVIRFGSWFLGRNPDKRLIYATYGASLSQSKSRMCRNVMNTDRYAEIFPDVKLSQESRSVGEWIIAEHDGGFLALGVGGGITGHGTHGLIIDDPVKNIEEAESAVYREKVWEWYNSTARTRLEPGAFVLVIMARWHPDDLAGRLLKAEKADPLADKWTVITYPGISEDGKALWPERFDLETLQATKASIGTRYFEALYQGNPRPPEGAVFKREWFTNSIINEPSLFRKVRSWDLAASTKTSADPTAGVKCSIDQDNLVVEHAITGRWEWPEAKQVIIQTAEMDGNKVQVGVEEVGMQLALVQELKLELQHRGYRVVGIPVDKDKYSRALPWVAKAEAGAVKLVRGMWNMGFLDEICNFTGKGTEHDDQVDATSQAYQMLTSGASGHLERRERAHKPITGGLYNAEF